MPNYSYEFGVTYLNDDLAETYNSKYIFCIIDIFNRKGVVYKHYLKE